MENKNTISPAGFVAACGASALIVATTHWPQPFLAILATVLLSGQPHVDGRQLARRIVWAWAGCLTGVCLLTAFPQQPWFSVPAFAALIGMGTQQAARHSGFAASLLFAVGLSSAFPAGLPHPLAGIPQALAHGATLTTAILVVWVAKFATAIPASPENRPPWQPGAATSMAVATTVSLIFAVALFPKQAVVTTIAGATTALAFLSSPELDLIKRSQGALAGCLLSIGYLMFLASGTHGLVAALFGLCGVLGCLECLAIKSPKNAPLWRQGAAMFAVAATTFPQIPANTEMTIQRAGAVFAGFAISAAILAFSNSPAGSKNLFKQQKTPA